jgi:hypothetical protein
MTLILNEILTVGVDCIVVLPDRIGMQSKRIAYIIQNISTAGQVITIGTGAPVVSKQSRYMNVGGYEQRMPNERPPQEAIYAISDVAGGTIAVYEESE